MSTIVYAHYNIIETRDEGHETRKSSLRKWDLRRRVSPADSFIKLDFEGKVFTILPSFFLRGAPKNSDFLGRGGETKQTKSRLVRTE